MNATVKMDVTKTEFTSAVHDQLCFRWSTDASSYRERGYFQKESHAMNSNADAAKPIKVPDWETDDYDIPPYLRAPERGSRLATENMVARIDYKINKLAALGLRPHPTLLGYRKELNEQLAKNGPYRLRVTSGFF